MILSAYDVTCFKVFKSLVGLLNRSNVLFVQEVCGYRTAIMKTALSWIFTVFTLGVLQLVFMWRPDWRLKCTSSRCHVNEANFVLVTVRLTFGFKY